MKKFDFYLMSVPCVDCQRNNLRGGPWLKNHIWRELGADRCDHLCFDCMTERAKQRLGRELRFSDLMTNAFNVPGGDNSWFNLMLPSARRSDVEPLVKLWRRNPSARILSGPREMWQQLFDQLERWLASR